MRERPRTANYIWVVRKGLPEVVMFTQCLARTCAESFPAAGTVNIKALEQEQKWWWRDYRPVSKSDTKVCERQELVGPWRHGEEFGFHSRGNRKPLEGLVFEGQRHSILHRRVEDGVTIACRSAGTFDGGILREITWLYLCSQIQIKKGNQPRMF